MTAEFWIMIAAIISGPLFAVLITFYLQRRNDLRQRRLFVFRSLMATRRTPLSPERVQALNLVEVEFAGERGVMEKFARLLETYNDQARWKSDKAEMRNTAIQEVDDRTAELLREIGASLGYDLENLKLLRGGYYPEAFSALEQQQQEIREFFVGLNNGSKNLPTAVMDYRHPQKLLDQARDTQRLIDTAAHAESIAADQEKDK